MEPVEPVQMNIYQSNAYRKDLSSLHFDDERRVQERQQVKNQQSCISVYVAYPTIRSRNFEHQSRHGNSIQYMARETLKLKKLHRTNQDSNFLGGSLSNKDNVWAPIQFTRESQPQHLKRWFFLKNRSIHLHINSTSVFRLVKRNSLRFSNIKINKLLPAPVQCLVGQIQVQKPILVVDTGQMPDHI